MLTRPTLLVLTALTLASSAIEPGDGRAGLRERVTMLGRETTWTEVSSIPVAFRTHHPQGLARIGDTFIISSVEIRRPTKRFPQPVDGYDRDTGEGVAHLFAADAHGKLLSDLTLGEGAIYHPGGIDFDGTHVWVPVAEYRPDSRSIVYRVDPATMSAREVLRVEDHIGAVVHDTDSHVLHAVSWGSRRFYRWAVGPDGRVTGQASRGLNPSHYVDYQDCKYVGHRQMLCSGVASLRQKPDSPALQVGGIDLVSLEDGRPSHQTPLPLWTASGLSMARNAVWFEPVADGIRGYFLPEDDDSRIYIYEAVTASPR